MKINKPLDKRTLKSLNICFVMLRILFNAGIFIPDILSKIQHFVYDNCQKTFYFE